MYFSIPGKRAHREPGVSAMRRGDAPHLHFLSDEVIQPPRVDVVVLEALRLQEVNEIFHGGPEVASDGQLLQSHHHVA